MHDEYMIKACHECMEALRKLNSGYYDFLQRDAMSRTQVKLLSGGMFITLFFYLCIPLSIKMALSSYRQQIRSLKLAKENAELEFNFLKSQINPHFLFNSLNNIYGLILNDEKEKSARIVARLSEFLRYSLYDWTQDKVPVLKEIQLLKDYIELESIRLNHTKVTFRHETDGSVEKLASLLMIPIIENAFKFSPDNESAFINIQLSIKNKRLHFSIENSVDPDRQMNSSGGIGLTNFKKRLELYYPHMYDYTVKNSEARYSAILNINLIWT
jgi:LytS/YehU family sensor histidine kinase